MAVKFLGAGGASVTNFGPTADGKTFAGNAPAGASVAISTDGFSSTVATVTADASGLWAYTFGAAPAVGTVVSARAAVQADSTIPAPALTLQALVLSSSSATVGQAFSATISGRTAGSTLSLSGAGAAGLSISGTTVSGTPTTAGPVDLVETLAGATNSPRTTSGAASVSAAPALPTLPLPAGTRMAFHGDSQMHFSHQVTPGTGLSGPPASDLGVSSLGHGLIAQAHALDPRIDISTWYDPADPWYNAAGNSPRQFQGANQGIAADHLVNSPDITTINGGGIIPRLDYTLAKGAQLIFFEGGTNTIATGDNFVNSADYVIGKLDEGLKKIRAAGKWCIFTTIWPRSDFDAAKNNIRQAVNAWIKAQAGRDGVVGIMDAEAVLAPGGVLDQSMYQVDAGARVHLSPKGCFLVARDFLNPLIAQAVAAGSAFNKDQTVSNLLPATVYNLTGTGGLKPGGTGAVADGCRIGRSRGAGTYVAAKETISSGVFKQTFTFTSSGSDTLVNGFDFSLPAITAANIVGGALPAAGTWLRAHIAYEVLTAAEAVPITTLILKLTDSAAAADRAAVRALFDSFSTYGFLPHAGPDRSGWLSTPPLQIPADITFDQINLVAQTYIDGRIAQTVNPQIKFSKPILRAVTDPRPAWGY